MEVVERVYVLIRQAIFVISGFIRLVRESLWRRIYQMKTAIGSVPNVPYRVLMTLFFDEDLPLNGLNSSSSVTSDVNQSLISNVSADEFRHLFTSLREQRQSHPEVILAHLNVNGLLPKFDWISLLLHLHLADFPCLSETKIDESVMDASLCESGYELSRNDRDRHGGGVCMYISSCLPCKKFLLHRLLVWRVYLFLLISA